MQEQINGGDTYNLPDYSHLKNKKWYNPNKFNSVDSAVAYLVILAAFVGLRYAIMPLFKLLIRSGVTDYYLLLCIDAVVSQSAIIAVALIYSKILSINCFNGGGFTAEKKMPHIMAGVLLIVGMLVLFIPATEVFVWDIYTVGGNTNIGIVDDSGNAGLVLLYAFVLSTVLPGICEELLFRGVILKGLLPYGKTFAIIMSSLMFAIWHGSFQQLLYQFLAGLAIGCVFVLTKNIIVSMVMHFANNLFSTLIAVMPVFVGDTDGNYTTASYAAEAAIILIGAACFVVGAVYFIKMALSRAKKEALGQKTATTKKSLLNAVPDFEGAVAMSYDEPVRFSQPQDKVYFYHNKKGFKSMRKKAEGGLPKILLVLGVAVALAKILLSYFGVY